MSENIYIPEGFLFIEKVKRENEFNMTQKHFHSYYEIYYLLTGERYYFIEDRTYHIKKGTIVFINSNQVHRTSVVNNPSHERYLIRLNKKEFQKEQYRLGELFLPDFFSTYFGAVTFGETDRKHIEEIFSVMLNEFEEKQSGYKTIVLSKLAELAVLSLRARTSAVDAVIPASAKSVKHEKVHEVADFINTHYTAKISLEDLAKEFYVSKYYLSRIFKEVTGLTIIEYINLMRVKHSKALLDNYELDITEIAYTVGFESLSYYERVFKNYNGTSPLKYRKNKLVLMR